MSQLFKRRNLRKTSIVLLVAMTLLMVLPVVALASNSTNVMANVQAAISGNSVNGLTSSAQKAGDSIVTFLRLVAIIVGVIMLIIVAYGLMWSPNTKTLAEMKLKVGALVLSIVVIFMAEQIVGTLMHWFGFTA